MVKKDITFIYSDSAEKAMFTPLYEEAKRRGYTVKMTDNPFEKCEIGFYCQHMNFPQYSQFSVIMLHDIIQQYSNWPDIWFNEPWNKYDIGILPSNQWVKNWNQCSQWYYTRPRIGMYQVGWPKADAVLEVAKPEYKEEFYKKYNLDPNKRTILYAPAWENDNKQDDFVRAMLQLDVNIIIKQYDASPITYPETYAEICRMYEMHKDIERVTILPAKTNIFNAIAMSDILVSEESSTMAEAIMMGIPAVSVSNWLIPDVKPSRFPKCDYDFVVKTNKEDLKETIAKMVENYEYYKADALKSSKENFSNVGTSSKMIMDILDDCLSHQPIRYEALQASPNQKVPFKRNTKRRIENIKREIYRNYCVRYKFLAKLWSLFVTIRSKIKS